jgi:hypothetical protein
MGAVSGSVEIPPDGLIRDNQSHFVVDFLRRVHVLVVNGSSRTVPHRDETFFLRAALRPADGATARVNATYVKPDELTPAQLAYVDVVILANVVTLDPQQVSALEAWVQRGGGLFVTGGENVSEAVYNGALRPLIPLPVREIREAGDQPLFLTGIADGHPLLNVFGHLPDASLYSAPTERYVLLDTAAQSDVRVLATFTDGAPALVEGAVGKGRLMMLTTTLDRDWSSLAFTTSYLPLMQQIILYLSGRLQQPEQSNVIVGLSRTIQVGRDVERIMVVRPDGQEFSFDGADLATGEVRFRPTTVAGIYRVLQHRLHGVEESFFSVGIDPVESVLRGTDHDEVESLLESGQRNSDRDSVHPVGPAEPVPGRRENLWPLLLIALFVLLVMETWLAYQAS